MFLEFYKKGQGYYTRLGTAIGTGFLAVYGCWSLHQKLKILEAYDGIDKNVARWLEVGIPALLLVVLAWLIFKAINKARFADFMIETEGEMKKVSWSSRKEVIASTKVVITTVIVLAVLLAVVDQFFVLVFREIGILKGM